ncbi:SDR family oxidoreductase [Mesorhizobium sp. BR1-1-16]|uniref:SDR family oxidoreductase n=1 Tax=Mesorhizobium sp. BR1-1-16 TaxID=2876653 RepID=UPI001CCBB3DD|nr:SDR family oxidoreductase [Mesorhizobium sp. BR1-1-16]MBZ9936863.1 SDR family oxidoreductase [Mesorhizobium sp. BR1-1-16]
MADEVRTALVTGAGSGIGRAIATALVQAGYRLVAADIDEASVGQLAAEFGADLVFPLRLDVTDKPTVDGLLDRIPAAIQPIDVLVNNAGHDIGGRTRFDIGSADDWSNIIDTNLAGTMRVTRAILPQMVACNRGDIVNMSSISAIRLVPDMAAYTASKAGIRAFTDVLRGDLAETAIRVTEILPGLTRTNIIRKRHRGDEQVEREYFERYKVALEPEDIARSVMFALSQPPHMQIAQMYILPINRW